MAGRERERGQRMGGKEEEVGKVRKKVSGEGRGGDRGRESEKRGGGG